MLYRIIEIRCFVINGFCFVLIIFWMNKKNFYFSGWISQFMLVLTTWFISRIFTRITLDFDMCTMVLNCANFQQKVASRVKLSDRVDQDISADITRLMTLSPVWWHYRMAPAPTDHPPVSTDLRHSETMQQWSQSVLQISSFKGFFGKTAPPIP